MFSPRSLLPPALLVCVVFLVVYSSWAALPLPEDWRKAAAEWGKGLSVSSHPAGNLLSYEDEETGLRGKESGTTTDTTNTAPTSPAEPQTTTSELTRPIPDDKIIVIGRLQREDTSWVAEHLPDWQNAIYTVDNTSAPLHTARNKGREANPYLLYIIENYYRLPSIIAFLHSHRDGWPGGWHTDAAGYDNVVAMQTLQLDFVRRSGYVNLRCIWVPGCPDEMQYLRNPDDLNPENVEHELPEIWKHFFGPFIPVPEVVATPCCAQFAVSREQVLKRPREDYQRYHQWLMDTPKSDAVSGRVFEYLWHIIFGKDAVHCPDMDQCYRDVYGR